MPDSSRVRPDLAAVIRDPSALFYPLSDVEKSAPAESNHAKTSPKSLFSETALDSEEPEGNSALFKQFIQILLKKLKNFDEYHSTHTNQGKKVLDKKILETYFEGINIFVKSAEDEEKQRFQEVAQKRLVAEEEAFRQQLMEMVHGLLKVANSDEDPNFHEEYPKLKDLENACEGIDSALETMPHQDKASLQKVVQHHFAPEGEKHPPELTRSDEAPFDAQALRGKKLPQPPLTPYRAPPIIHHQNGLSALPGAPRGALAAQTSRTKDGLNQALDDTLKVVKSIEDVYAGSAGRGASQIKEFYEDFIKSIDNQMSKWIRAKDGSNVWYDAPLIKQELKRIKARHEVKEDELAKFTQRGSEPIKIEVADFNLPTGGASWKEVRVIYPTLSEDLENIHNEAYVKGLAKRLGLPEKSVVQVRRRENGRRTIRGKAWVITADMTDNIAAYSNTVDKTLLEVGPYNGGTLASLVTALQNSSNRFDHRVSRTPECKIDNAIQEIAIMNAEDFLYNKDGIREKMIEKIRVESSYDYAFNDYMNIIMSYFGTFIDQQQNTAFQSAYSNCKENLSQLLKTVMKRYEQESALSDNSKNLIRNILEKLMDTIVNIARNF